MKLFRTLRKYFFHAQLFARKNITFGVRSLLGVLLIVGGIFAFLPILGIWMLPVGIAFISVDFALIHRHFRKKSGNKNRSRNADNGMSQ